MSRFFAGSLSDSDYTSSEEEDLLTSSSEEELLSSSDESQDSFFSESESEEDFDDSDDENPTGPDWFKKPEFRKGGSSAPRNAFLKGADSDDDSDDESGKKVVKSARDKLLDEFANTSSNISKAKLIEDWVSILGENDALARLLIRAQQQSMGVPNIYIKTLVQLDDLVNTTSVAEMSKNVSRAYNTTKQRVKKAVREHDALVAKFRAEPESFDREATVDVEAAAAETAAEPEFFTVLKMVAENRGKKNTDVAEQVKTLEQLFAMAKSPYEQIVAYLNLIPFRFDSSGQMSHQPAAEWKKCYSDIAGLLQLLEESDKYVLTEHAAANTDPEVEPEANAQGKVEILGSVLSFVERLDDELANSLLSADSHSAEYVERLRDDQLVYELILRVQKYVEAHSKAEIVARVISRRLDHVYYKSASLVSKMDGEFADREAVFGLVDRLCEQLKATPYKKRALLSQIYFYAVNGEFVKAREMLQQSQLQTSIANAELPLQTLFNRVLVQISLAAFKLGLYEDAQSIVAELATSARLRDLLGQSRVGPTPQEVRKPLPFHQHINVELVECVYLVSCMLTEPLTKKRPQNKFRRQLEHHERQAFQGPPENARDFIMYAGRALATGDWSKCFAYLNKVQGWKLFGDAKVVDQIKERVQVEALRTYVYAYRGFYSKVSLAKLAERFALPAERVETIVGKMLSGDEIHGSIESGFLLLKSKSDGAVERNDRVVKKTKAVKN